MEWTEPLGFNNTFAMIIRKEDAQKLNLRTISDAVQYTPGWTAGFGYEFVGREDGYPGLVKTYGLRFPKSPRIMDLGLTYRAVAERQVDFIAGNSTDGLIDALDSSSSKMTSTTFLPTMPHRCCEQPSPKNIPGSAGVQRSWRKDFRRRCDA